MAFLSSYAGKKKPPRKDFVFPAGSSKVNDGEGHFPLNTKGRAYSALQAANTYKSAPDWYDGSLKELVKKVCDAVKRKYKDIDVSEKSCKPGKQSNDANDAEDGTLEDGSRIVALDDPMGAARALRLPPSAIKRIVKENADFYVLESADGEAEVLIEVTRDGRVRDLIGPRFQDPDSDQRDAIFSWFSDSDDEVEELDFEERPEAGRAELDLDRRFDDSFDDDGWGADKSDGKRSDFVFPASDDRVNDGRGHFPLNTKGRAYSALAFANAYHKAPRWFKGSLKELVRDVCDGVKKQYPDIHVNWKSCVPGKQSSRARVPGGLTRRAQQAQQGDVVTYATFAGPLAAARQAIGPYFQLAKAKNNAEAQRWGQWLIQTVPEFDRLLQQHEGEPWANQAELKMFGDSQAETLEWLQSLLPEIAKATTQLQSGT